MAKEFIIFVRFLLPIINKYALTVCEYKSDDVTLSSLREKYSNNTEHFKEITSISNSFHGARCCILAEKTSYGPTLDHSVSPWLPAHMSLMTARDCYLWNAWFMAYFMNSQCSVSFVGPGDFWQAGVPEGVCVHVCCVCLLCRCLWWTSQRWGNQHLS